MSMRHLPYFAVGIVVKGFGRGSKELGIPTANLSEEVVEKLPSDFNCGIYCGWAKVDDSPVYKTVMSIGWNPFYHNEKKSMEAHILHDFADDFYGATLHLIVTGYLRPEKSFSSVDDLIAAIRKDINDTKQALDLPENQKFQNHEFFKIIDGKITNHC